MNDRGDTPKAHNEQGSRDRKLFVVIASVGVLALFFGFLQVLNTIRSPFQSPTLVNEQAALGPVGQTIQSLSQKDTDSDGINDFDELYVYQTSPYLGDSDSDGMSDQVEIANATNPNCPVGEVCSPLEIAAEVSAVNTNATPEEAGQLLNAAPAGQANTLSADELRVALRNAGAPAATLDDLSDAELLDLYEEVSGQEVIPITETNINSGSEGEGETVNTNTGTGIDLSAVVSIDDLSNLTPEQIREFLIQGGADPAAVNQVDDETLRLIFEEALQDFSDTEF